MAFPCIGYRYLVQHQLRAYFFLCGGHFLVLLFFLISALLLAALLRGKAGATIVGYILGTLYGVSAILSWYVVTIGSVGF
jgi:hypothetical protein